MKDVFIHQQGICESHNVGKDTRIWAFAHVLPHARIGSDCNICNNVFIENDVIIGNRVTIKPGVQVWDGIRIEDDAFIGPNVTFSNDHFPRSKQYLQIPMKTVVGAKASIGANATILPGLTIGSEAMIGAGAVVVDNVPPKAIVIGNPGRIKGYTSTETIRAATFLGNTAASSLLTGEVNEGPVLLKVGKTALYKFHTVKDLRGDLTVAEFSSDLPFIPQRLFMVNNVPSAKIRGEHAHLECEQLLIAQSGTLSVVVDDGFSSREIQLDSQGIGLYLPKMTWGIQYKYTPQTVLMVLASHPYSSKDYIREYDTFLQLVKSQHDS